MFDQGRKRGRPFENFHLVYLMALRNLVAACRIVCEFVGGSKIGRRWGLPIEVVFVSDPLDTRLAPKFFPRSYCDKITSKDLWIPITLQISIKIECSVASETSYPQNFYI